MRNMKSFLERLQNADESVKKRWLVALSAIAMLIIIVVWTKYFAFITQRGSIGQESASGEFSFWETMKIGASVLWEDIRGILRDLGRILGAPRSYIIKP